MTQSKAKNYINAEISLLTTRYFGSLHLFYNMYYVKYMNWDLTTPLFLSSICHIYFFLKGALRNALIFKTVNTKSVLSAGTASGRR